MEVVIVLLLICGVLRSIFPAFGGAGDGYSYDDRQQTRHLQKARWDAEKARIDARVSGEQGW